MSKMKEYTVVHPIVLDMGCKMMVPHRVGHVLTLSDEEATQIKGRYPYPVIEEGVKTPESPGPVEPVVSSHNVPSSTRAFNEMKKDELLSLAKERGLAVKNSSTVVELIEALSTGA